MIKYFDINAAGHSIRCKLFGNKPRDYKAVVLCGHGFAGHKDNRSTERFAETLLSKYKQTAVLIFDWPGHGKDVKKHLTLQDCDTYLSLVLDYVRAQMGVATIYGYANSFGGYLFLKYIHEHGNPFEKIAFRCPAIGIYDSMLTRILQPSDLEKLQNGKDALVGFDRKTNINALFLEGIHTADVRTYDYMDECEKMIIIQGTKDEIVDYEEVKAFAENNLIDFIPIANADHRFQDYTAMGNVIREVIQFFFV